MAERHGHPPPEETEQKYQALTVSARALVWWGLGLVLLIGTALGVSAALASLISARDGVREPPLPPREARRLPTEPPVRADLQEQLDKLRAAQRNLLQSYGWIDREDDLVHIPIDEAAQILLKRGLPARTQQPEDNAAPEPTENRN